MKPVELTDSNFADSVKEGISLVDFWAEWCGPCLLLGPYIEVMAKEYEGKVTIGKLNVDDNPEVSMQFGVRSIPTVLILKDGEVVDKQIGLAPKSVYTGKIEALLETA